MSEVINPPASSGAESTEQDKVVSLFKFIREINELKQKKILNIQEYPWIFKISNLPDDEENINIYWRDRVEEESSETEIGTEDILLSVHKPEFQRCPQPDDIFADWLLTGWDDYHSDASVKEIFTVWSDSEHIKKQEEHPDEEPVIIKFDEDDNRVSAYQSWLKLREKWVETQQITEKTRNLFFDLYNLYFELQRESETEEIICANGILCDKENPKIKHPVLTHRVKLDYDADENTVYILDTEVSSELYSIVFQIMEDINLGGIQKINEELLKKDYHPLDRNDTPAFLKTFVHQLSSDSIFSKSGVPENWSHNSRLLLYIEPCYIVRKRLDGTPKAIEKIIENVKETGEIPAPIRDIVSGGKIHIPEDVGEETIEEQLAAVGGESVDILLSKEANKEQLEIARRIEYYNAVLVQGPPGTGKTHTISNLMGHFLAQGKSILVTSHTKKALSVLKDKVVPGLQNLCVSLLDDSNADMERSIDGITSYISKTTSHELKREMDNLAIERREVMDKLADVRRKIFAIINQECNCIVYNGEELSPSKAASFVVEHSDDLSYIPGKVRRQEHLPLTFEQLTDLYRSNESVSEDDEKELATELPSYQQILSPSDFESTWNALQSALHMFDSVARKNNLIADNYPTERQIRIEGFFGNIAIEYPSRDAIVDLKEYARSFGKIEPWMKAAAVDGKNGGAFRQRWLTLIDQIEQVCKIAESIVSEQFGVEICYKNPDQKEKLKDTYEILKGIFADKKKIGWFTLKMHKDYGEALNAVTLNGNQPQTAQDCEIILHDIEAYELRRQCAVYWDQLLSVHGVPKFFNLDNYQPEQIAKKWIGEFNQYLDWYINDYQPLLDKMNTVGLPPEDIFKISTLDSDIAATDKILTALGEIIPAVCDICTAALNAEKYASAINEVKSLLLVGKRGKSRVCTLLLHAVEEGDVAAYTEAYAELERIYEKYSLQNNRINLLKKLEPVAPEWAEAIRSRKGIHGQNILPGDIEDAWKWKQLYNIIEDITKKPFSELQAESLRLSKEYRTVTAQYAEKCSWYHLLRKTEADIDMRQALQGWKLTVKKIGKGTGKSAPALKEKARELMTKCQNAVPGWIMPITRALETLNPKSNRFDIIIIDEASQSDISSLAILYMGKKLIIVGDDKQVSPMAVGVEVDKMSALEQMYIEEKIPNSHLYNAKLSIYDIASTTFQPLMLREHFRCVPEIIGFSNMLSYDYKIKPLRDASSSILLPAVVNYRVANGQRDGRNKTNINEAKAIVALMQACMEQPEYSGKSFGIISLLGDRQVKVIQRLIEERIDPKEIIQRNILCGNSANFQGDERDVIFLSLVDSGTGDGPIRMMNTGSEDAYRKRYNVAASRARDQLWVVDSLDPANDLKPGDIRKILIDYSLNPNAAEIKHEKVEKRAESPFEAAVAMALSDRGYHLEQQWKVGSYRLDIVAVCGEKKVAIECDGERWHSSEEKIREDMERQTILERLGWRFIRIRGSEFYSNREKTIERVISELTELGIEPEEVAEHQDTNRETKLLNRVRIRAAEILGETEREESGFNLEIIGDALNPGVIVHEIESENNLIELEDTEESLDDNQSIESLTEDELSQMPEQMTLFEFTEECNIKKQPDEKQIKNAKSEVPGDDYVISDEGSKAITVSDAIEEAVFYMSSLNMNRVVIDEFKKNRTLYQSEGPGYLCFLDSETEKMVRKIEVEREILAFHVIDKNYSFGHCSVILNVPNESEVWEENREILEDGMVSAFVYNWTNPEFSERGNVNIVGINGGVMMVDLLQELF